MLNFSDQVAVVTGASSGIGRAIALNLTRQGATACLVGRNLETLNAVARVDPALQSRSRCCPADLTRDDHLAALKDWLWKNFQTLDVLVHYAGVIAIECVESARVEELDWQYQVNLRAPFVLTQAVLPRLCAHHGQIVFINSSVADHHAPARLSQYSAMKCALKAFVDGLRDEVNPQGIRVLTVYPGRTASRMQEYVHQVEGKAYHPERLMQPDDIAIIVVEALALPHTAEETEIHIRPMVPG